MMKWTLYLMLFTTPAANVTNSNEQKCLAHQTVQDIAAISMCRPKFEGKRIWSLQATSQFDVSTLDACVGRQDQLIANSNVASTMTLRSWCFCDSDKGECPTEENARKAVKVFRNCEEHPSEPKCQPGSMNLFSGDILPKGANSSSIRLYPP